MSVRIAAVVLLLAVPAFAQQAPSLADLARKVEKERATGRKAAKTFTNADLAPVPEPAPPAVATPAVTGESANEAASAEAAVKPGETKAPQPAGAETMPEQYWRERAAFIRTEAARAVAMRDGILKNPVNSDEDQARNDAGITRVDQMLAGLKKQWADLQAAIKGAKLPAAWIAPSPNFP